MASSFTVWVRRQSPSPSIFAILMRKGELLPWERCLVAAELRDMAGPKKAARLLGTSHSHFSNLCRLASSLSDEAWLRFVEDGQRAALRRYLSVVSLPKEKQLEALARMDAELSAEAV